MSEIRIRRRPSQSRSKERYEHILHTARELIGERGIDAVSMREIAATAEVPIASVYHYFPDKSTLLYTIMEEYHEQNHAGMVEELNGVSNLDEFLAAIPRAIKRFMKFLEEDSFRLNIVAGAQADPRLLEQDKRVSRRDADLFVDRFLEVVPGLRRAEVKPFALLFVHTMGSIARLSLGSDPAEGKSLIKESLIVIELRARDLAALGASRTRGAKKSSKK